MKFTLTIDKKTLKTEYQSQVAKAAKSLKVKGFRAGKAPLDIVEKNLDPQKIHEAIINQVLPLKYQEYIKKNNLRPITDPKVTLKDASLDSDWVFDVEIAQKPEVELADSLAQVKANNPKIIVPGKNDQENRETKLSKIFDILLKHTKVEIPGLLINEEVNRSLSRMIEQIDKLGLTLEDYARSVNKTIDQIKQEYAQKAENELKLEFILEKIALEEKLEASEKEVHEFIDKIENPQTKQALQTDHHQHAVLHYSLTKRKVLDYLEKL
jgi:FKBP-type peptidyl-prolyl cis-trans isomerase (trigger factor)